MNNKIVSCSVAESWLVPCLDARWCRCLLHWVPCHHPRSQPRTRASFPGNGWPMLMSSFHSLATHWSLMGTAHRWLQWTVRLVPWRPKHPPRLRPVDPTMTPSRRCVAVGVLCPCVGHAVVFHDLVVVFLGLERSCSQATLLLTVPPPLTRLLCHLHLFACF